MGYHLTSHAAARPRRPRSWREGATNKGAEDPFGNIVKSSGDLKHENTFRFSTKYQDDETGLVYCGFRYYSPKLGRWVNLDPVFEEGGFNLFSYVNSNPINLIDPFGLICCPKSLTVTAWGWITGKTRTPGWPNNDWLTARFIARFELWLYPGGDPADCRIWQRMWGQKKFGSSVHNETYDSWTTDSTPPNSPWWNGTGWMPGLEDVGDRPIDPPRWEETGDGWKSVWYDTPGITKAFRMSLPIGIGLWVVDIGNDQFAVTPYFKFRTSVIDGDLNNPNAPQLVVEWGYSVYIPTYDGNWTLMSNPTDGNSNEGQ